MNMTKMCVPYKLGELVTILSDAIMAEGLDKTLNYEITDFCLYTREYEEFASADLVCYLEHYPDVDDYDEEIYPDFVVKENLRLFYSGEHFEDVVHHVLSHKNKPSMEECIKALNYYREHDAFLNL